MNLQQQIEKAKADLRRLEAAQQACEHDFGEPYRAVLLDRELIYENRPMGSDYFNPVVVGSRPTEKQVWKRTCQKCGLTETTDKVEPVVSGFRPKF